MIAPVPLSIDPADLPTPPQSALRIVQACSRENVDALELGRIVSQDPVLAVALLRLANSAYLGFRSEITSLTHAIALIGQRTLKSMVLCIAMRDVLKAEQLPSFPLDDFWEGALRRAVCARCLAKVVNVDDDVAFTVGLLQDFGLLVLFYLHHGQISEWHELAEMLPDDRYELEGQLFGTTHDKVSQQLAGEWNLPHELAVPMGFHHEELPQETSSRLDALNHVARCADWMAAVFTADEKRQAILQCRSHLNDYFKLSAESTDELLGSVSEQMIDASGAFGMGIGEQLTFNAVMREANLRLVEENMSYQELTWDLEHSLQERDRVASELNRELELAREVQRSLLPGESTVNLGIVGVNVSAKAVSGDFYDVFKLQNDKIAFCIADVSGKGMNAALLMAKTSSLFRCLGKSIHDPSKLLTMINREIVETSIRGMFVTLIAGVFDPVKRQVQLANAGHLPALQMHNGQQVREYPAEAPPLGVMADASFPTTHFQLGCHCLYLYTDGLLEAPVDETSRFGRKGLIKLLLKHAHIPPTERLQQIVADVRQGRSAVADDLTILLIEGC